MFIRSLEADEGIKAFPLASQTELTAFVDLLEREVPPSEACSTIKGLEHLSNADNDFVEASLAKWANLPRLPAGNPRFETMFAKAENQMAKDPQDPEGPLRRMVQSWRQNVEPLR